MKFINFPCRAWNEKSETEKGNQTVITAIPISPCFHSLNTSELLLIFFVIEAAPILHRCLNKIGIMEAIPNVVADDFPNMKVIGTKRPSSNSLNTHYTVTAVFSNGLWKHGFPALKISWGPPSANLWPDWSPQKRVNRDKLDQR